MVIKSRGLHGRGAKIYFLRKSKTIKLRAKKNPRTSKNFLKGGDIISISRRPFFSRYWKKRWKAQPSLGYIPRYWEELDKIRPNDKDAQNMLSLDHDTLYEASLLCNKVMSGINHKLCPYHNKLRKIRVFPRNAPVYFLASTLSWLEDHAVAILRMRQMARHRLVVELSETSSVTKWDLNKRAKAIVSKHNAEYAAEIPKLPKLYIRPLKTHRKLAVIRKLPIDDTHKDTVTPPLGQQEGGEQEHRIIEFPIDTRKKQIKRPRNYKDPYWKDLEKLDNNELLFQYGRICEEHLFYQDMNKSINRLNKIFFNIHHQPQDLKESFIDSRDIHDSVESKLINLNTMRDMVGYLALKERKINRKELKQREDVAMERYTALRNMSKS